MNTNTEICCILWEKITAHKARILRVYGTKPAVTLPTQIAGCIVAEIGCYCFSKLCRLPEHYLMETYVTESAAELCGSYIESVSLPESVTKIGDYAFFDCRSLQRICFGSNLKNIGSDAFMNCHKLHELHIRCGALEKSGLNRILSQITWDIEVLFCGNKEPTKEFLKDNNYLQSVIFYPEYYESYEEITPAHIFGQKIIGEGFRARQCFLDDVIDYVRYDSIFQKACTQESVLTVCHIALCRLCYPINLLPERKIQYEQYIYRHSRILCQHLIKKKNLHSLYFLFDQNLLDFKDATYAISLAVQSGWSEGSASLLRLKQKYYPSNRVTRYELEDF